MDSSTRNSKLESRRIQRDPIGVLYLHQILITWKIDALPIILLLFNKLYNYLII